MKASGRSRALSVNRMRAVRCRASIAEIGNGIVRDHLLSRISEKPFAEGHLLAISGRSVLTEVVTDFLVSRGNHQVVASTVGNRGAKFSTSGMSTLVTRAQDDDDLALRIWSRPDISRHDLVKLFAQAQRAAWELH